MPEDLGDPVPTYSNDQRVAELLEVLIHVLIFCFPALPALVVTRTRNRIKEIRDNARPKQRP